MLLQHKKFDVDFLGNIVFVSSKVPILDDLYYLGAYTWCIQKIMKTDSN